MIDSKTKTRLKEVSKTYNVPQEDFDRGIDILERWLIFTGNKNATEKERANLFLFITMTIENWKKWEKEAEEEKNGK